MSVAMFPVPPRTLEGGLEKKSFGIRVFLTLGLQLRVTKKCVFNTLKTKDIKRIENPH